MDIHYYGVNDLLFTVIRICKSSIEKQSADSSSFALSSVTSDWLLFPRDIFF